MPARQFDANASPEKRLFISLLTRDITLVAAVLDLIDNSVNAAIESYSKRLKTADGFLRVFSDNSVAPSTTIEIDITQPKVRVSDDAAGISIDAAKNRIFRFGRADPVEVKTDRLSVYGIGLKRAMFKLGNLITMRSEHVEKGFDMRLNVSEWETDQTVPWTFQIAERAAVRQGRTGTEIEVTDLHDEVKRRLNDGVFESQLRDAISKTYAYFLAKFVTIKLNGKSVPGTELKLGSNHSTQKFEFDGGTCSITAGIGVPEAGFFRERTSGWFILCNGRVVISADKTPLTGWGSGGALPVFQPKHRPFLGVVFFVSEDPEKLPWTTTKSGINEDSAVWQTAKRHMATVGRAVISFLDGRYTDEGTEVASKDLSSGHNVSALSAAAGGAQLFKAPAGTKKGPTSTRIQYDAKISEVKKIADYLKKPSMSGSDIGRHTFSFFLKNEVGGD